MFMLSEKHLHQYMVTFLNLAELQKRINAVLESFIGTTHPEGHSVT
jgi:hypothetical protein